MFLTQVDEHGTISWHCANPACTYHNCAAWGEVACPYHPDRTTAPTGSTIAIHASHDAIQWLDAEHVRLATCPGCDSTMTSRIHRDEEKMPPRIFRDEMSGEILQVVFPDGSNPTLWRIRGDVQHVQMPHEAFAKLPPAHFAELLQRMQAAGADTSWMMQKQAIFKIRGVEQAPTIANHERLAAALIAAGKPRPAASSAVVQP